MNFKVIEDDKEINCEVLLTFRDDNNDINYIVYTDGTKDENDELDVFASRYIETDNNYVLHAIQNESEWNLIDNMIESKFKGND